MVAEVGTMADSMVALVEKVEQVKLVASAVEAGLQAVVPTERVEEAAMDSQSR